ncbi:hypothetical protein E2542_SST21779 [Spatholobus suberectus]|nr:hypothetical protein E2542_SST21779 [Spatholobus suberectus]
MLSLAALLYPYICGMCRVGPKMFEKTQLPSLLKTASEKIMKLREVYNVTMFLAMKRVKGLMIGPFKSPQAAKHRR